MARKQSKIPSVAGVSSAAKTEAWLAASRFREMQPQLTSFARSITGNERVQVYATHKGAHSIGNKIFIRPPLALGRNYPHDRQVCGSRGDDGRQECAACRVREVVDFYLYHEIGHVWLGTQDRPEPSVWTLFDTLVEMWHPAAACNHGPEIREYAKQWEEVMPIANTFHKYLGLILNALEDSRVNEGMFDTRPGLRRIFEVNIERLMSEGMDFAETGEVVNWSDAPADAQFTVGLSMLACNYDPEGWLHGDIVDALKDPRVLDITSRARHAASVHDVFELAVRALFVANSLGYCIIPKCEVPSLDNEPEDPDAGTEPGDTGQSGGSSTGGTGKAEGSSASSDPGTDSDGDDPAGTGSVAPGDEENTDPEPKSDDPSSESPDDDNAEADVDGDGTGTSVEPNQEDDGSADEADAAGGGGSDREDDDAGHDRDDEPQSGGGSPAGGSEPSEQARSEAGQGAGGSPSPGAPGDNDPPDESGRGADDLPADGDGDEDGPAEGGDGPDVDGDSDADGEDGEPSDSPDPNPWNVAAPEETGSDDEPTLAPGTVEDAERALAPFLMHGTDDFDGMLEDMLGEALEDALNDVEEGTSEFVNGQQLVLVAISQVAYFDDPSASVAGVEVINFPCPEIDWVAEEDTDYTKYQPSESSIGAAVLHARIVFQENKRSKLDRNQKSGKVNSRVLARRAPVGDDRLFGKKTRPKRRSYLVIVTGDCSGSTQSYGRSAKIRRMMMAQGDLLHRIGVPFIMMGHSAARARIKDFKSSNQGDYWQYALMIKEESEGWGPITKNRLAAMGPVSENLDGHTLEYCRKLADKSQATDVIIIYYTDGEMPAANATEEREVLEREVKTCKRKGYHLLGVGINTDSPKRYGLKTVRVESDDDIKLVVEQLEKELTQ